MAVSHDRQRQLKKHQRKPCACFIADAYFEDPIPLQVWASRHYGAKYWQTRHREHLPDVDTEYQLPNGQQTFLTHWELFCNYVVHPTHKLRAILDGVIYMATRTTGCGVEDLREDALALFNHEVDGEKARRDLEAVLQAEYPCEVKLPLARSDPPRLFFAAEGSEMPGLPDLVARIVHRHNEKKEKLEDLRTLNGFIQSWIRSCVLSGHPKQQVVELLEGATYLTTAYTSTRGTMQELCGELRRRVYSAMPIRGRYIGVGQLNTELGSQFFEAFIDSGARRAELNWTTMPARQTGLDWDTTMHARLYMPPEWLTSWSAGLHIMVIAVHDDFKARLSGLLRGLNGMSRQDGSRYPSTETDSILHRMHRVLEDDLGSKLMERVRQTQLPWTQALTWDRMGDHTVIKVLTRDTIVDDFRYDAAYAWGTAVFGGANDMIPYWF